MKKPKHFIIFKIFGFVGLIIGIGGIVLAATGFGNFENSNFIIGAILASLGLTIGIVCLVIGFAPEISRLQTKTHKYIQEANEEDLRDISTTKAEITSNAVKKVASSIKEGLDEYKLCKNCNKQIPLDSNYCKYCGKKQD